MSSIKRALKAIFPRVFLKRVFLVHNRIKSYTTDSVFFKPKSIPTNWVIIQEEKNPFNELQIDVSHFDKVTREKLVRWTDPAWTQDQYLVHYASPGFIEPKTGWGVSDDRKLIYPSLGFALAAHVHKPDFIETYFRKKNVTHLRKVISLRDTGEENYFHFFNDVLAKLLFLQDNGIALGDYTIVVSTKLYEKQYFQYFLKHAATISALNWYVQKSDWVRFDEAIFCKPYTHTKKYFDRTAELVKIDVADSIERRVFLTRSKSSLRFIENSAAVESLLSEHAFETVDASKMSFDDQVKLFGQCRYLVAVHGAGLTNMIFRAGKPMSVLEIAHPSPYIPFHYIMLSKMYGYEYNLLLGHKGAMAGEGGFKVDLQQLMLKVRSMLKLKQN